MTRISAETQSEKDDRLRGGTERDGRSPRATDRDQKTELAYVVVAVAGFAALTVSGRYVWALAFLMATLFMFGIWRIARGQFR